MKKFFDRQPLLACKISNYATLFDGVKYFKYVKQVKKSDHQRSW